MIRLLVILVVVAAAAPLAAATTWLRLRGRHGTHAPQSPISLAGANRLSRRIHDQELVQRDPWPDQLEERLDDWRAQRIREARRL